MLSQIIKSNTIRALKTVKPQMAFVAFKPEQDCDCTCSKLPLVKKSGEDCGTTGCSC
jgi:hypothetical protein